MNAKVAIVVLNWNGWQDTLECLASLSKLNYPNYQVVVVDNASTDNSEVMIRSAYPNITLLQAGTNLGFAGGNNIGICYSLSNHADYVWLLNNDTVVAPDALTHLVDRIQVKSAGMCGSTLLYYHTPSRVQALAGARYNPWLGLARHIGQNEVFDNHPDPEQIESKLDYIVAASLLVSKEFLQDIGLMNEDYFLYYEELDWAVRAKGRYSLAFAASSIVWHKEGASIGSQSKAPQNRSSLSDYYGVRNRIVFTRRFYPRHLFTVLLGLIGVVTNRIARRQFNRVNLILQAARDGLLTPITRCGEGI